MLTRENLKPEHIDAIASGLHLDPEEIRAKLKRFSSRPKYVPMMIKQELSQGELSFVESHSDLDTFPELLLIQKPAAPSILAQWLAAHVHRVRRRGE